MDDLIARLRRADEYEPLGHVGWEAADRIEALEAKLARMEEALVDVDGPNIGAPTPEPGLMTILCRYYMLHTHQDDAADLAERYIAALQGEG